MSEALQVCNHILVTPRDPHLHTQILSPHGVRSGTEASGRRLNLADLADWVVLTRNSTHLSSFVLSVYMVKKWWVGIISLFWNMLVANWKCTVLLTQILV